MRERILPFLLQEKRYKLGTLVYPLDGGYDKSAGVAELVDAQDLKSWEGNLVPVRFRPSAPTSRWGNGLKRLLANVND